MAAQAFRAPAGAAVALTAATAKSVIGVKAGAGDVITLKGFTISFDGVTASAIPVLYEVCKATFASNAPGTNSTAITPSVSARGKNGTPLATAARTWTAANEPTVLVPIDEGLLTPCGGLLIIQFPLGGEFESNTGEGFTLRLTAPAAVNFRGAIEWEE